MEGKNTILWPYKRELALLTIPLVWFLFVLVFFAGRRWNVWSGEMPGPLIVVVGFLSILPLLLVILDFFATSGAVIDIKGVKVNFGKLEEDSKRNQAFGFEVLDNMGIPEAVISDSGAMNISRALEVGSQQAVVIVNIKAGNAWWVTRLLVLCAGAVRTGSPKVLVFLGKRGNMHDYFLGFGRPQDLLDAILRDKSDYMTRYEKSARLSRQLQFYSEYLNTFGVSLPTAGELVRYTSNPSYMTLGPEVFDHILLDQLRIHILSTSRETPVTTNGSLENPPDRITINRLHELFDHCLYTDHINCESDNKARITQLLGAKDDYVALVRNGIYTGLLKKQDGEELILRGLVLPVEET